MIIVFSNTNTNIAKEKYLKYKIQFSNVFYKYKIHHKSMSNTNTKYQTTKVFQK